MKNKEKYAKEILEIACSGSKIAIDKNTDKICACDLLKCRDCIFDKRYCAETLKHWCESEYVEPPVDWSKVAVDTPILVRDSREEEWRKRYFAKYEDNTVYAWSGGTTSWSTYRSSDIANWKMAKLAEREEKND